MGLFCVDTAMLMLYNTALLFEKNSQERCSIFFLAFAEWLGYKARLVLA